MGWAVREQRHAQRLTLQELASRAGSLSFRHLGDIERGEVNPRWDTVARLADALDLRVGDLEAIAEEWSGDDER